MWLFAEFFPELLSFFQRLHKRFDAKAVFVTLVTAVCLYYSFSNNQLFLATALFAFYIFYMKVNYIDDANADTEGKPDNIPIISTRLMSYKSVQYEKLPSIRQTYNHLSKHTWLFQVSDSTIKIRLDSSEPNEGALLFINHEKIDNQKQFVWLYFLGRVYYAQVTDMDGNDFITKVKMGGFFKLKISLTIKQLIKGV